MKPLWGPYRDMYPDWSGDNFGMGMGVSVGGGTGTKTWTHPAAQAQQPPQIIDTSPWKVVLVGSPVSWRTKGKPQWANEHVVTFTTDDDKHVELRPGMMSLWIEEV